MGSRKVSITEAVSETIAEIAWYIEAKGLVETAERFVDEVYDFFYKLSDTRRIHSICREPTRALLGYKCVPYKKKYTIVFMETSEELLICEFILSKQIHW